MEKPILFVEKSLRVRKDNLYVPITSYRITKLELELESSIVGLWVDFHRDGVFIFRRRYDFGDKGDISVDDLIRRTHEAISNVG
jgi:hypothetical protein